MKIWILKAIIQKTISFFPSGNKINFVFQKHITKGVHLNEKYFFEKLDSLKDHLNAKQKHLHNSMPVCLELGTGWYPIIPIGLYLSGVKKTYTIDTSNLMNREQVIKSLEFFLKYYNENKLNDYFTEIKSDRINCLKHLFENNQDYTLNDLLEKLNMHYLVGDARQIELPDQSVDFILSNNTLEHIPKNILIAIFKEFKRIIHPKGLMSHFIDMSDHFAHLDKSITIYNFLKYSNLTWKIIDNSIQPQNRLRIYNYRRIYKLLNIPVTEERNRKGDLFQLSKIKINKDFRKYSREETAISHSLLISKIG